MMRKLVDDLFVMAAGALGLPSDFFIQHMDQPTYQMLINRYPPLREVGTALPGQFRISPHSDFNTLTILDRQPGVGGLQVEISGGRWENAPYATDAFIVNVGDTLSCWTG